MTATERRPPAARIEVNGINLSVQVDGPEDGRPVLLLHGFPDSAYIWRHQVAALTGAGYRTIAIDQRGYGELDAPEGVDAYAIPTIAMDAVGVLDALGVEQAAVVGHDWGASVAWLIATLAPDRVERLCVVSVGHPTASAGRGATSASTASATTCPSPPPTSSTPSSSTSSPDPSPRAPRSVCCVRFRRGTEWHRRSGGWGS